MPRVPRVAPVAFAVLLLSPVAPAVAQSLENGVGSQPSEMLSVPPNRRGDPDFAYGARATRPGKRRHEAAGRRPRAPAAARGASGHAGTPP